MYTSLYHNYTVKGHILKIANVLRKENEKHEEKKKRKKLQFILIIIYKVVLENPTIVSLI